MAAATIHWSASPADHQALAQRRDWGMLTGLEQLWPSLAEIHGDAIALEAPHAAEPETISYSLTAGKTYVLMVAGWSGAGGNWEIAGY